MKIFPDAINREIKNMPEVTNRNVPSTRMTIQSRNSSDPQKTSGDSAQSNTIVADLSPG